MILIILIFSLVVLLIIYLVCLGTGLFDRFLISKDPTEITSARCSHCNRIVIKNNREICHYIAEVTDKIEYTCCFCASGVKPGSNKAIEIYGKRGGYC